MIRSLFVALLLCGGAVAQSFIVRQATVVDGTGAAGRIADVLVQDGRIAKIGSGLDAPAGTPTIDGRGRTLLPGLFDLHTHLLASAVTGAQADWPRTLQAYLLSGVTTVADMSTYPEQFEPMRGLIAGGLPAPRLILAARFSSPGGHGLEGGRGDFHTQAVLTPRQARAAVKKTLEYKPGILKVFTDGWRYGMDTDMTSMDEATLKAIVEEAHAAGVKVITHTVSLDKAKIAARAGSDIIGHGVGDALVDAEWLALMKASGIGYVSTLAVYEPRNLRDLRTPFVQTLLDPTVYSRIQNTTAPPRPAAVKRWENLLHNLKVAKDSGVAVGLGTDAGMGGAYHGWSTLRELELAAAAGLTPMEALTAATSGSAKLLGIADRGVIAQGKLADMVLVAGKPHESIADIFKIERVWLGGVEQSREPVRGVEPPPFAPVELPVMLDDFESQDGRSRISTLWVNRTDFGHDHTNMVYQRVAREQGGHALHVTVVMADKEKPLASMVLPLSKGAILPADLTPYRFLDFEVRGEGDYRFELERPGLGARMSPFSATPKWSKVRIGLGDQRATALVFNVERAPGEKAWLEIDNLRLVPR
ncbi:MAG TPA: amidohydrolase family protein [Bryobacteraceae bacterium]|nr:amidohydrolase family protein [Bryobacteraceae bacterium]